MPSIRRKSLILRNGPLRTTNTLSQKTNQERRPNIWPVEATKSGTIAFGRAIPWEPLPVDTALPLINFAD
jgi:hypothetical protein